MKRNPYKTKTLPTPESFTEIRHSWAEFIEQLDSAKRMYESTRYGKWAAWDVSTEPLEWLGGISFTDALGYVKNGWDNAPFVEHMEVPDISAPNETFDYRWEVAGEILDVAAYVNGEPEHWMESYPVISRTSKILKISLEIGGMAVISASELKNRGLAIVALIHSLELNGYSCQIDIVRAYTDINLGKNIARIVSLKEAGTPLNMERTSFVIGHPSFYRRCLFSLQELDAKKSLASRTESYVPKGYDFHFAFTEGLCESSDDSFQWAKTKLLAMQKASNR